MALKLAPGEGRKRAALKMLGDARLTHEIVIHNGMAYLKDERSGPPTRWQADPRNLKGEV